MEKTLNISMWQKRLEDFAKERDWDQFHNPKNLVMAMSVESSELVEIFQWLSSEQSENLDEKSLENATHEMADILLYLIRLSSKLNIDLEDALEKKFEINKNKYPVELARGTAKKYSELKSE